MMRYSIYPINLATKEQNTLIGLPEKQSVSKSYMSDKPVDILLDTGGITSMMSKDYINNLFPSVLIKDLHDILSDADMLQVRWGN